MNTEASTATLSSAQLHLLQVIFSKGSEDASRILSKWLRSGVRLTVDSVEHAPIEEATQLLGPPDEMVVACTMGIEGRLAGNLIIAFGDESGLALVDQLMLRPAGTSIEWGEVEQSAVMETANIVGSAYLNSLNSYLPTVDGGALLPTPPEFRQDFAGSLLESSLMEQVMLSDRVLLIRTQFTRDNTRLCWYLFLVPELNSLMELVRLLED